MVFIGAAQQNRLFEAARRQLGPSGESVLRETARATCHAPLDQLTYPQLSTVLKTVEREAPARVGRGSATALAAGLRRLQHDPDSGLAARVITALSRHLGASARPFVETVCARHDLLPANLDKQDLLTVAQAVRQDAALLLGQGTAEQLAQAVIDAGDTPPEGFTAKLLAVVTDQLGTEGEGMIRALCRDRLEVDLDMIDADNLSLLAQVVERDGAAAVGAVPVAAFLAAARQSITSPAEELRGRVVALACQYIGPVGEEFLQDVCRAQGLPFRALDYEHLMWLAEALRAEAAATAGKQAADDLARAVRGLLTGGR